MTTRLHVLPSSYCSTASVPQQKNRTDSMMTLPAPSPFSPLFFLCAFFAYPQAARPRRVCVRAWGLAHVLAKAGSPSLFSPVGAFARNISHPPARRGGRDGESAFAPSPSASRSFRSEYVGRVVRTQA